MNKMQKLVLALVLFCVNSAVCSNSSLNPSCQSVTWQEKIESSPIVDIELNFPMSLVVKKGDETSLTITMNENNKESLKIYTKNNTLVFSKSHNLVEYCNDSVGVLTLQNPLQVIHFFGSGKITIEELYTDSFFCEMKGSGTVEILKGLVENQKISIKGSGKYLAEGVTSSFCSAEIRGSGKVILRVEKDLKLTMKGSGICEYYGDPKTHFSLKGSNSVTHKNN